MKIKKIRYSYLCISVIRYVYHTLTCKTTNNFLLSKKKNDPRTAPPAHQVKVLLIFRNYYYYDARGLIVKYVYFVLIRV